MQILAIEFSARRYHATPWDAHVNEGRIEWPPCPWRLMRALLAVGYCKRGWTEGPTETAATLLKKLSASPPSYALPQATETHSRHYMPAYSGKMVKVFDAFLRFGDASDRLYIRYDVDLTDDEREEFRQLVNGLAYLGRAESWVEANLLDETEAGQVMADRNRTWHGMATSESERRVRLLAPLDELAYDEWRSESVLEEADQAEVAELAAIQEKGKELTPAATKKKIAKARAKVEEPYPSDLITAFQQETSKWQSQGWPRPPGSHWVNYEVPVDLFERKPLTMLSRRPRFTRPEAILLSVDGEGKRGALRPKMQRALPLMELLHSESVRYAGKRNLGHLPELTGTNADGAPLRGEHKHAHWLPLSLFNDSGWIDHVLVYAPGGFSKEGVEAISDIRWAYAKGISALSINMVGQGSIAEMLQQLSPASQVRPAALSIFGSSKTFDSATPLVLRKYLHRSGKKTVEGQIREELLERGYPEPQRIEIWPQQRLVKNGLKGFVLRRNQKKRQPPCERSWALTIQFARPIENRPLSLGYASHFGLGLFRTKQPLC